MQVHSIPLSLLTLSLFNGHLVLDVEVPSMYMDKVPLRDELEFTKMRYTAITCDPNDFVVCLPTTFINLS